MADRHRRRVYLLSPKRLSPETIAVTFAKTSRSPLSFRDIAAELTDKDSAEFHEKWVVGYGHASVAEHAVLHVAFENVSRLAIECIESNRLASYTEKSTRYQRWEPDGYHAPVEVTGSAFETPYRHICGRLFETYAKCLEVVRPIVQDRSPRKEGETQAQWDSRIRSRYVDSCRYLLPAAALANVGMTVNARTLEHALRKMLSHPLAEVRNIGKEVKEIARAEVPTLVKYADEVPYLRGTREDLAQRALALGADDKREMLRLVSYDPEAETTILAAALYENGDCSFEGAQEHVRRLSPAARMSLADALLQKMDRFDVPPRVLEHATYTFEAVMDQGAYFEAKRHRIMTQTPQRLSADLGFAVPRLMAEAGVQEAYTSVMGAAAETYGKLAEWDPHVASYVVPNAFRRRVLMTLNLREAFHFCELRSQPSAHFAIRRIALRMSEILREVHPILAGFMRLPPAADWRVVEADNLSVA